MAVELTENSNITPGIDYAITELFHCKSRHEKGVIQALTECTGLYLDKILSLSKAKVIICLGRLTSKIIRNKYGINN
jgi:uracil-DNA glycosylase